jgi:stress-induced-phosphoprotein 1
LLLLFQYEECIKDCDKAVERGRELRSDFKMIAKALTRKGTALVKMAKCSKDYEPAIECFQKALTEHRNPDTLKKLNDAEKARKELEQQEYFDPNLADVEREKGIAFYNNLPIVLFVSCIMLQFLSVEVISF